MAQCIILESFKGSQDGRFTTQFNAGDTADLSEYLMQYAPRGSFQRIDGAAPAPAPENKATITTRSRAK